MLLKNINHNGESHDVLIENKDVVHNSITGNNDNWMLYITVLQATMIIVTTP
jgi:hypothetical protein